MKKLILIFLSIVSFNVNGQIINTVNLSTVKCEVVKRGNKYFLVLNSGNFQPEEVKLKPNFEDLTLRADVSNKDWNYITLSDSHSLSPVDLLVLKDFLHSTNNLVNSPSNPEHKRKITIKDRNVEVIISAIIIIALGIVLL